MSTKSTLSLTSGVLIIAMLMAQTSAAQELNLRAVYNAVSGVMAPIWVAQEGGLFAKHGVNVDLKYLAATTAVQGMVGVGKESGLSEIRGSTLNSKAPI